MYITLQQLSEKPGVVELAQVTAQVGHPPADWRIISKIIEGEDVASEQPAAVEKAQQAIARIDEVIVDSSALIDGYLRQRGYKLPFKQVPRILTTWARAIVRYSLHQHLPSEEKNSPIVRDYRDALKLLQLVAEGKFSLGLEDTLAESSGEPKFIKRERVFTAETLKDY
ncbi:gp436 family protein [Pasteurella multocida]